MNFKTVFGSSLRFSFCDIFAGQDLRSTTHHALPEIQRERFPLVPQQPDEYDSDDDGDYEDMRNYIDDGEDMATQDDVKAFDKVAANYDQPSQGVEHLDYGEAYQT